MEVPGTGSPTKDGETEIITAENAQSSESEDKKNPCGEDSESLDKLKENLDNSENLKVCKKKEVVIDHCEPTGSSTATSNSVTEKRYSPCEDKLNSIYHIKWISQNNHKTPIVTQNENGPCPLIAIINVLIMRGRVKLPLLVDIVTTEKLMEYLGDCILDSIPKNIPEVAQLNYEQNIHDAMAVLPKLQTGLDVNVKFTGIGDFEYTPECIIFDLLQIPLYHGWLIDPQIKDVVQAVGTCSYNQLVEKIINCKSSMNPDEVTEALIAENFLEKTASQLTYHGLCELTASLKEEELCVLFRNNHFISLVKQKNLLYQLVTDQGFLNENVVWETLNNIEGDGQFVDSSFVLVPPKPSNDNVVLPDLSEGQQIDQDEELARRLQEEENQVEFQTPEEDPVPTSPPRSRSRDCIIL